MKILKWCGRYLAGFGIAAMLAATLYAIIGCTLAVCNVMTWPAVVGGAIGCGTGTGLVVGFVFACRQH